MNPVELDRKPSTRLYGEATMPNRKGTPWHVLLESMSPNNKQVRIGLTSYIFGIGDSRAAKILTKAEAEPFAKVGTLDEDQLSQIRQVIEAEGQIEGDLQCKDVSLNIKRLIEIQSWTVASVIAARCPFAAEAHSPATLVPAKAPVARNRRR